MNQKNLNELETQLIFCTICESAYIETTELSNNLNYICNMCKTFETQNNVQLLDNNLDDNLIIDSSN